jgi:hypothetical protein
MTELAGPRARGSRALQCGRARPRREDGGWPPANSPGTHVRADHNRCGAVLGGRTGPAAVRRAPAVRLFGAWCWCVLTSVGGVIEGRRRVRGQAPECASATVDGRPRCLSRRPSITPTRQSSMQAPVRPESNRAAESPRRGRFGLLGKRPAQESEGSGTSQPRAFSRFWTSSSGIAPSSLPRSVSLGTWTPTAANSAFLAVHSA